MLAGRARLSPRTASLKPTAPVASGRRWRCAPSLGRPWRGVQSIGDRDPAPIAEYVQERMDALEGAADLLDRGWTQTVTEPSRTALAGLQVVEWGSSRGRTRTCDPLRDTRQVPGLGRRKRA